MGQLFSNLRKKTRAPLIVNDRIEALVSDTVPIMQAPTSLNGSQTQLCPKSHVRADERNPLSTREQRHDSNGSPSSDSYAPSTAVDTEGSPSTLKHAWNGGLSVSFEPSHQHYFTGRPG